MVLRLSAIVLLVTVRSAGASTNSSPNYVFIHDAMNKTLGALSDLRAKSLST
jgi:hypothetical protein